MKNNKSILRKEFLEKRKNLSSSESEIYSQKIHDLLFSRLMMHRFSPIHIFLPIKKQNEVDTWKIIETLRKDFQADIFISKSFKDCTMLHQKLEANTTLVQNKWGIFEFEKSDNAMTSETFFKTFELEDILIFLPLLIFDRNGQRVGYGKGYYDRFLSIATKKTTTVGLSFFEAIDGISDLNSFDLKMDYCVTPSKVWSW